MLSRRAMKRVAVFLFCTLSMAVPALAAPIVVYTQPAQSPVVSTRASQNQAGLGLVFQTFDSFSLAQNTLLSQVLWQGSYFNSLVIDPSFNPPANATAFGVSFYADNGLGSPGSLLSTFTFSPGAANQTFVGQQAFGATTIGLGIYNYAATLTSGFLATAGTTYWLSVYAFQPQASTTQAQWGWNGGTGGNGLSVQNGIPVNFDRAFTLTGTVPEPSSLALFGSAAAALLALRRRVGRRSRAE